MRISADGNVGIGTTTPGQELTVSGTIQSTDLLGGATTLSTDVNGNIIRTPSDRNLKEDIKPLKDSLDKLMELQGVSYDFKDKDFGSGRQIGFIAQDVKSIFPEVVSTGGDYLSLNYGNLVAVVVEAVKEIGTHFRDGVFTIKEAVFERVTTDTVKVRKGIEMESNNGTMYCVTIDNDGDFLKREGDCDDVSVPIEENDEEEDDGDEDEEPVEEEVIEEEEVPEEEESVEEAEEPESEEAPAEESQAEASESL